MNDKVKNLTLIAGLFWKFMERVGVQGIAFMISIILARLLLPEDYGMIALVTIFIAIANVIIQSGFNTALIQKKNIDETDLSSVFYLNLLIAGLLYTVLYITAPVIANFYNIPELVLLIRILSITLFFGAITSIQDAIIARKMLFKKVFFSSIIAVTFSGISGIVLAYSGFGVWSLVIQQLIYQVILTIIYWFAVKWRPQKLLSKHRLLVLFSFGWKILIASLIDTIYSNSRSLIIGKLYNPSKLGFYNRGQQFPALIVTNINSSIQSVMLPALSSEQHDIKRVKDMVRRSIVTSSFLIFPIMVGLAIVSDSLVIILLTDKWLPAVPFLQIYCFIYALFPMHTANLQAINALGRSDIFLKLEIVKKSIGILILVVTASYGIYAIAIGGAILGVISTIINTFPNRKLLNYGYKEQMRDIAPSFLLSLAMGVVIYSIKLLGFHIWPTLIIQIIVGGAFYFISAYILKIECYFYLLKTSKELLRRK